MTDATETHIRTIPKNASEEIHVALTEFKGHQLCDLRVYAEYQATGEVGPTKKGLTVAVGLLPDIIDALSEARAECERRGLLPVGCPSTRYAEGMTR